MIELMLQAERALMVGMVDQAERLYLMASKNDPRNAIAVVGLARVALERNDDHGAYDFSRRALEIDPDNAAALRLEARLSEVLTHRGEDVERPAFVLPGGPGIRATTEGQAARRKKPAADPFPPARKHADEAGRGPLGTVMGDRPPGWQPARMPDAPAAPSRGAPASASMLPPTAMDTGRSWSPPGCSGSKAPSTAALASKAPTAASSQPASAAVETGPTTLAVTATGAATQQGTGEPQPFKIRPSTASSGPTRFAVSVVEDVTTDASPVAAGGVPQTAVAQRPWDSTSAAAAGDADAPPASARPAAEPGRRSFLRRLFGH